MYLPIHRKMLKELKKGMKVVHNGGGVRQGESGRIVRVGEGVIEVSLNVYLPSQYTENWFLDNFYISVSDISSMVRFFNGSEYINKYENWAVPINTFNMSRQVTHRSMKLIVDRELLDKVNSCSVSKEDTIEAVNHNISQTTKGQDPMDKVGDYKLCTLDGHLVSDHKTQRLAETAGVAYSRDKRVQCNIWKLCATTEPKWEVNRK